MCANISDCKHNTVCIETMAATSSYDDQPAYKASQGRDGAASMPGPACHSKYRHIDHIKPIQILEAPCLLPDCAYTAIRRSREPV
jgi:hypothetical protein